MTRILNLVMREDEAEDYIKHHASLIKHVTLYDVTLEAGSDDLLAFFMLNAEYVTCHSEWFTVNGDGTVDVKLDNRHFPNRRGNSPKLINDFWYNKARVLGRAKSLWHEVLVCDGCIVPGHSKATVETRLRDTEYFSPWLPSQTERAAALVRVNLARTGNHLHSGPTGNLNSNAGIVRTTYTLLN